MKALISPLVTVSMVNGIFGIFLALLYHAVRLKIFTVLRCLICNYIAGQIYNIILIFVVRLARRRSGNIYEAD